MTTDTTTRPLPVDVGQLSAYLPPAPTDTSVTRAAEAMARIRTAIRSTTAMLADLDRADRDYAVAAERSDTKLVKVLADVRPGNRVVLGHHHDILRRAWALANQRHTAAETSDPEHVAWRRRCEQVDQQWRQVMSIDDSNERFAALATFAETHNPR